MNTIRVCCLLVVLVVLLIFPGTLYSPETQAVVDHCRLEAVIQTGDPNAIPLCSSSSRLDRYWSSIPQSIWVVATPRFLECSSQKMGKIFTHVWRFGYFWVAGLVHSTSNVTRYADLIYVHYRWFKLDWCFRGLDIILFFCIDLLRDLHCALVESNAGKRGD